MHRRRARAVPLPRSRRWRPALLTALLVGALSGVLTGAVGGAAGALAAVRVEAPLDLATEVTDPAGVLGGRAGEVEDAVARLADETRYQLFVVLVDSFDGADPSDWANQTAIASGLGVDDIVLAVAVEDRRYAVSVDDAIPLTDEQLDAVRTERIEPALSEGDWAGAAVAAADGFRDAAGGGSGLGSGGSAGPGSSGLLTWVLLAAAVVAAVLVVLSLRRRGSAAGPRGAGTGPEGLAALPTPELSRRAGGALVALDDALKTSEQELGFAEAQFGAEATHAFTEAVAQARTTASRAFTLRQRLDDAAPETEEQARAMMLEILALCADADAALDAQAEDFDRLRDLHAHVPEVLARTDRRAAELQGRLPGAQASFDTLAATYLPATLASVAGNVPQATALLTAARAAVVRGNAAVPTDRGQAVAEARAAEDAVGQAATLLDAVDRAGADLAAASGRIDAATASLTQDVQDAARLAPGVPAVTAAVAAAQAALATAATDRSTGDPLAALRRLVDAETALDAALAPARDQAEQAERARTHLAGLLGQLTSQVRAVADFIETRRGAVGAEARTRLAEAARLAQQAERTSATDPVAALGEAHRARELAGSAQQLAEADVARWEQQEHAASARGGGPDVGSLVLGGILVDRVLGGGRSGRSGGGFGGGSSGSRSSSRSSGSRSSGRSSGSFGGGGSRGRRGGGGRF